MLPAMAFKLPESVLVVVYTPRLDVLLLERTGSGLWQSVTGSREPDDPDLEATARRELMEETGLAVGTLTNWRQTNRYEIWAQWRARATRRTSPTMSSMCSASVLELEPWRPSIRPSMSPSSGCPGRRPWRRCSRPPTATRSGSSSGA